MANVVITKKAKAPTKKEVFTAIEAYLRENGKTDWADKMAHEIELLTKKSGSGSAKKNEEHEEFFEVIRDILAECPNVLGMQCGAIAKDERAATFAWKDEKETTPQRVSAMLKKMVDKGDVVKTTDKKVTYFRLA